MGYPALRRGQRNLAVRAMQNGLHRALAARGKPHRNSRNGKYGPLTVGDVIRFKKAYRPGGSMRGNNFGSLAWGRLKPYLGQTDREYLSKHWHQVEAAKQAAEAAERERRSGGAVRARIGAAAMRFYNERSRFLYQQIRPYNPNPWQFTNGRGRYDCSSAVTVFYLLAGAADPNGRNFDGQGYTGTQWPRGSATRSPRVGDLAFYGWQGGGIPSHVAIVVPTPSGQGGTWVVSFGSNPVRLVPLNYRSDFRGCRTYL